MARPEGDVTFRRAAASRPMEPVAEPGRDRVPGTFTGVTGRAARAPAASRRDVDMSAERGDARIVRAYRDHRPYLIDLAFRMLGDIGAAEDAVQDAFTRLLSA